MRVYHSATSASLNLDLANLGHKLYSNLPMEDFNTKLTILGARFNSIVQKSVSILLGGQSLYGLYESAKFILFDRLSVESAISEHQVDENFINHYFAKIITTILSVISLWFAVHLFGSSKKISKNLQTILAIILIFANAHVVDFLDQIPFFK